MQTFKPVKTKRAYEEVCDQIRAEIQSGHLSTGDHLPSERELARLFHVSRATIREALRTLEIAGVLSLHKGVHGGAIVTNGDMRPIMQTMEDLLSLGGLSLKEYTEARVCVQREIIQLVIERGTEEDFTAMEENIERMREYSTLSQIEDRTKFTVEFYTILAAATKNRAMSVLMAAVTEPLSYYIKQIGIDRTWDVAASRTKFVGHLRERNAELAIYEMMDHMQRLHKHLLSYESNHKRIR